MKTVGSLFAGIGGFDLAARWVGWQTKWFSEIDEYASRVFRRHFPNAIPLGDITTITNPPSVDVLVGGFPCQDISVANARGKGIHGERSGLWKHYARIIGEVAPSWVVIENSPRLRAKGLDVVLSDLMALGYDAEWHCIPASAVGAPHQRDRIWIIAYPAGSGDVVGHTPSERERGGVARSSAEGSGTVASSGAMEADHASGGDRGSDSRGEPSGPNVADAGSARLEASERLGQHLAEALQRWKAASGPTAECGATGGGPTNPWLAEPGVFRVADGVPDRAHRIRCLGNAVVPQIPYLIFNAITQYEAGTVRMDTRFAC